MRATSSNENWILSAIQNIEPKELYKHKMITYPNQKVVQVKSLPHNGKDKTQPYGCINIEASNRAARVLKPNAYRMYIRIVLNQDGHEFALSPKAMREEIGISPTGYETAVKNLIDAGYLVQISNGSNKYFFYENPPEKVVTTIPVCCPPIPPISIPVVVPPNINVDSPQNLGEEVPKSVEEIIQDITDNTNNKDGISYPRGKRVLSNAEKRKRAASEWLAKAEEREQERIRRIRQNYRLEYQGAMQKAIDTDNLSAVKYELIIKRYLADHPESKDLRRAGDKYGRWIHGWDEQKQEPIIVYSYNYLEPKLMKQEIGAIPKSYYMPKKDVSSTISEEK